MCFGVKLCRQKAFWDEQDVHGVDDKCRVYNPHLKVSNTLEAAYGSTGVSRDSCVAPTKDLASRTELDCVSEDASDEAKECVLCRSKVNEFSFPSHCNEVFIPCCVGKVDVPITESYILSNFKIDRFSHSSRLFYCKSRKTNLIANFYSIFFWT